MFVSLIAALSLSANTILFASAVNLTVTLDYGSFTGIKNDTTRIISFRGIRYADPPVGDLRWRAPVSPPTTKLGNVDASQFADACIQTAQTTISEGTSEDCLYGNVNVPYNATSKNLLPVMIWFHGGGFQKGSTHDAPPDYLIPFSAKPMIFVSFEYRLGQFGFLGGPQVKANGDLNAGLLDQRAALRWVQKYIKFFGGDRRAVTIWGESAGAGGTMYQLIANGGNNEGLFHAAMGDSPSLNYIPHYADPYIQDIFSQFSSLAGCAKDTGVKHRHTDVIQCLRKADGNKLALAGNQTIANRTATLYPFAPYLDGTFVTKRPVEAFKSGCFAQVPVLFGSNTNEGSKWSNRLTDLSANTGSANATEDTVYNFLRGQFASLTKASFKQALKLYPLADYQNSLGLQGQQMYGEMRYICTAQLITGGAKKAGLKAFNYHYDNPITGSDHGSDLDALLFDPGSPTTDNANLFEAMREYWTSFVTSGAPVSDGNAKWKPVTDSDGGSRILLHPGAVAMEEVSNALKKRCRFWHGLSAELNT